MNQSTEDLVHEARTEVARHARRIGDLVQRGEFDAAAKLAFKLERRILDVKTVSHDCDINRDAARAIAINAREAMAEVCEEPEEKP